MNLLNTLDFLKGINPLVKNAIDESIDCNNVTIPTVDESAIECSEFVSTNCIKTPQAYTYLGISNLETLTSVITKIINKFKTVNDKFKHTIDLTDLNIYADDTAAGTAGIVTGKPYIDTQGFLRIKQ
jgi:hypothetical protein